ncbi:hypothetical protein [Paracoccus sp. 08]|uniref:hypothetical protein n=1 Tax=Paracoccus sp. 08 TaxID=2606624 RepID=UPI00209645F1|nr:hypothetical protein [Paracoccus sp. 08]MCO6361594.1 hypothetical protein [Paracoccus sp. 08]
MSKFEHLWREQCEAAETVKTRYGEQAAFDYLVGEKLLNFVSAAKDRPEFAAQLPAFVAGVRQLFSGDAMASYLETLEVRLVEKTHDVDDADMEILGADTSDLECLRQIADLLRTPSLGTA